MKQSNYKLELKLRSSFELNSKQPFNFSLTVNKYTRYGTDWFLMNPFEYRNDDSVITAIRLGDGSPIALKILNRKRNLVTEAFHNEPLSNNQESELLNTITKTLGLDHDIREFYNLAKEFPILKNAIHQFHGMRISPLADIFTALLLAITLQRASYGRTEKMLRLLFKNYGQEVKLGMTQLIVPPSASIIVKSTLLHPI